MIDIASMLGGLIVSCQAPDGSPLRDAGIMAAMAEAAVAGGAVGIRANSPEHVAAIKRRVDVPVIGLFKRLDADGAQWITPGYEDAAALAEAGADVIAMDGTGRPRPNGASFAQVLSDVRERLGIPLMADVDDEPSGVEAARLGAAIVGTTLSGYTPNTRQRSSSPDIELVARLAAALDVPVLAEGRYATPADVTSAFEAGAASVVVGTAITEPTAITRSFVAATKHSSRDRDRDVT